MNELELELIRQLDLEDVELIEKDEEGYHFEAMIEADEFLDNDAYHYVSLVVTYNNRVYLDGIQESVRLPMDVGSLEHN